jgi:acetate kinase
MAILVVNCGSSSLKAAVIEPSDGRTLATALAQRLGSAEASLRVDAGERIEAPLPGADHARALTTLVELLAARGLTAGLTGVGHRVVHGGTRFSASALIDAATLDGIRACVPLAPLHNPANLLGIELAQRFFPGLPQVAVFDTAFHTTMPAVATTYAVPRAWREGLGVRRYGFHGTSHRFVAGETARILGRDDLRLVIAHLGNGCSATAVAAGRSVDTTMGLTPLEGLVMGTRSGSVDPAIIGHVARALGIPAEKVIASLNSESGLTALSGGSNDMRRIQAAAAGGDADARLAVDVFCYVLAKQIAGLVVALGGLDALVFTGGIGENDGDVRRRTVARLGFLGLTVDDGRNARNGRDTGGRITVDGGAATALVVPTNEELLIARDTAALAG